MAMIFSLLPRTQDFPGIWIAYGFLLEPCNSRSSLLRDPGLFAGRCYFFGRSILSPDLPMAKLCCWVYATAEDNFF